MVLRRGITAFALGGLLFASAAAPAVAQPGADAPAPVDAATPAEGVPEVPPPPDGAVESTPPAVTESPDGWRLELGAENETQSPVAPLTTALSTREYVVGGTYTGSVTGPGTGDAPSGTLEVGYEIGCGIDMSTSNGVSLTGTAGVNSSLGLFGTDFISPLPDGLVPGVGANIGGGVTVGLKPGFVNVVTVTRKEFTGADPWVMVSNFRVRIDGCVGESFIRSYAFLSRSTDMSEAIVAWYGVTTTI
ncbi:MspA family porin [Mycobacterium sp. SMC-4]|uniref:MspA family porin n=1 Tax=Mycobacterium sp. SMC-4 TaxID=2857059 RepID=UPI0037C7FE55